MVVVGGHAWHGGVWQWGMACVARGACMDGRGCVWWGGMCGRGVCMAGEGACMAHMSPPADTMRYDQWAGGTHPTGMQSCLKIEIVSSVILGNRKSWLNVSISFHGCCLLIQWLFTIVNRGIAALPLIFILLLWYKWLIPIVITSRSIGTIDFAIVVSYLDTRPHTWLSLCTFLDEIDAVIWYLPSMFGCGSNIKMSIYCMSGYDYERN